MLKENKFINLLNRNVANCITILRIVFSIAYCFFDLLSPMFLIFYSLAGITDVFDGLVARKTKTVSSFGSKLDSFADFVFFVCLLIKLLISISLDWRTLFILVFVFIIKILILAKGFKNNHHIFVCHNLMNKVTGFVVFLIPFLLLFCDSYFVLTFVCLFALVSAFIELYTAINTNFKIVE